MVEQVMYGRGQINCGIHLAFPPADHTLGVLGEGAKEAHYAAAEEFSRREDKSGQQHRPHNRP